MGAIRTISRKDLAAEWGISPNVIDNMLQRGQLKKLALGLIDYDHAQKVRAAQSPVGREREAIRKAVAAQQIEARPEARPAQEAPPAELPTAGPVDVLLRARTAKTLADARIADLNHKRLAGSLVEIEKVKKEAADAGRVMVARLRTMPSRLGPMLASMSDPAQCIAAIDKEVGLIVTELREALAAL